MISKTIKQDPQTLRLEAAHHFAALGDGERLQLCGSCPQALVGRQVGGSVGSCSRSRGGGSGGGGVVGGGGGGTGPGTGRLVLVVVLRGMW